MRPCGRATDRTVSEKSTVLFGCFARCHNVKQQCCSSCCYLPLCGNSGRLNPFCDVALATSYHAPFWEGSQEKMIERLGDKVDATNRMRGVIYGHHQAVCCSERTHEFALPSMASQLGVSATKYVLATKSAHLHGLTPASEFISGASALREVDQRAQNSEGPSTQYFRVLVPKTIPLMVFGTRVLKFWVLGPSGKHGLLSKLDPLSTYEAQAEQMPRSKRDLATSPDAIPAMQVQLHPGLVEQRADMQPR